MRTAKIVGLTVGILLIAAPAFAQTPDVQSQIASLLAQVRQLQTLLLQLQGLPSVTPSASLALSFNLYLDLTDKETNGEISKLQRFLQAQGYFNYPEITGYYGPATVQAVQRWQAARGVVSTGSPDTTGYGYVGPKSRALLACAGAVISGAASYIAPSSYIALASNNTKSNLIPDTLKITYPSSDTNIGVGQKITITYSVGGNIVASDPAIVERKIVNAGTDTTNSGYTPVSVSGGIYTFDWIPNEAGKYQAVLNITHNNTTYPARSATITAGNPTTPLPVNTSPSIIFSHISSGNVIGSYANLPANSQIRLVNSTTGQPYFAQSTMVWAGGSGQLSIPIPNDLPNGSYFLRATDYYNPNTTIGQSSSFQAGSNVQTNSVVINSFTASPSSVNAGGAVLFMWGSNLTQNYISHYGGGCSIEGLTQNNVAFQVTPGFVSGGTVTYVPPATATYTLLCSSGAKDGSPSATKKITVNVGQPQTNPVTVDFGANQNSVASGQPVTFLWNSNLTENDISYYGGFCSISALTSYNQEIHITGGTGASGSVTYTPALTATYTLMCSAGAKDGSPMATKQVTVSVY